MCYVVRCSKCNKSTWRGCGAHVEEVMSGIPVEQRCTCQPTTMSDSIKKLLGIKT